ncbi:MFS transporter [Aestuariimicrobium soli]|uniref:MFS transporter n=1 Tax=Aestuariimicrobium soli TaxID=2035834 RepID=UPI003EBFBB3B
MTQQSLPSIGGWPFLVTAAVGRVPGAMVQLATLLFVTQIGGSLTQAGTAVAVLGLGSAIGAPIIGRLIDRLGALPVVVACTLLQLGGIAGFAALGLAHPGQPGALAVAFALGAANPQIGSIARGHWAALARDGRLPSGFVSRAMGYEGAVDEVSFVLGPTLAGLLLGLAGGVPGMVVIGALTLLGQGAFAAYLARAGADRRAAASGHTDTGPAIAWLTLLPVAIATAMVGFTFGSTQTALTAWFDDLGRSSLTGPVYGLVGVGSAVASLLVARLSPGIRYGWRIAVGAAVLVVAGALVTRTMVAQAHQVTPMTLVALLIGVAVGPVLVSGYSLAESLAPRSRLTTVMTVIATTVVLGVSAGAATMSRLVDTFGFPSVGVVLMAAGAVALVCGVVTALQRSPLQRSPLQRSPQQGPSGG